jgi:acetolactate synthase-1/2/3 large subunit
MKVADYIGHFLAEKNIRHIFGYQGGAVLKMVDAAIATGKIDYVQNYHEQASSFCADAYARISGHIGVAVATSGPGATNLVTGIANAQLDSVPTMFITGQDYSGNMIKPEGTRSNGFQDLDIVSIVKSITKYAMMVTDAKRIRYELERAYFEAKTGRPGAVLLDIPIDIQMMDIDPAMLEGFIPPVDTASYDMQDVQFWSLLEQSKRPLILAGGGIRGAGAQSALKEFATRTTIPVATTLNGLDVHDGSIGFTGLYGNTHSNLAAYNADLLIVLGARLGLHQVGRLKNYYTKAKVIHVDIDPTELNRAFTEDLSIESDVKIFLETLNRDLSSKRLQDIAGWKTIIAGWTEKYRNKHHNDEPLPPAAFVQAVCDLIEADAIMTSDVGQNQMWVAQGVRLQEQQRLLNSSGLGAMGYSLPAAIAAKYCESEKQVIAFMGDGGLQMNIQELQLVAKAGLDIKILVFNNNALGLIGYVNNMYNKDHVPPGIAAPGYHSVDLERLAATYGLDYQVITAMDEMDKLKTVLSVKRACLIEIKVANDAKLYNRKDEAPIFQEEKIDA